MSQLDDKIEALLKKQGLDEPDAAKAPRKKAAAKKKRTTKKKAQSKKAPAKKKTKKRPAKRKATKKKRPAKVATTQGVDPEQFAHAYIRNNCQAVTAYRELRPDLTENTLMGNAHRILASTEVQRVLWPLLEGVMEKAEAQSEEIIKRWIEQANASPLDYFHIDERGRLGAIDLTGITEAQRRNLRSIQVTDTQHGQSIKITVVDQQKATELLAKSLGMLVTRLDPETEDRIGDLLEAGVKRIQKKMDADAWKQAAIEGEFTDVG